MRREGYAVPDLVGLVIDPPDMQDSEDYPHWIYHPSLAGKFFVIINTKTKIRYERMGRVGLYYSAILNENNKSCHDVVYSMPDEHARTVTHLYLRAIRGRGRPWEGDQGRPEFAQRFRYAEMFHCSGDDFHPESNHPWHNYGYNLEKLETLQVVHPPVGLGYDSDGCCPNPGRFYPPERECRPSLSDALHTLCRNTCSHLRALSIKAYVGLGHRDLWRIINVDNSQHRHPYPYPMLNFLEALVQWPDNDDNDDSDGGGDREPSYMEGITTELQLEAARCSAVLKKPPSVCCHNMSPPWPTSARAMHNPPANIFKRWDQPIGIRRIPEDRNPNYYSSSTFLGIHSCVRLDERSGTPRTPSECHNSDYDPGRLRSVPPGCSGLWCGYMTKCVGAKPLPNNRELTSRCVRAAVGRPNRYQLIPPQLAYRLRDMVPYRAYRLGNVCLADPLKASPSEEHDNASMWSWGTSGNYQGAHNSGS